MINEIKYLMSLIHICVTHVSRTQNKANDSLASFGRIHSRTMTWLASGLYELIVMTL